MPSRRKLSGNLSERHTAITEFLPQRNDLGFRFIFGSAALWFILGTVMVSRIRGVR